MVQWLMMMKTEVILMGLVMVIVQSSYAEHVHVADQSRFAQTSSCDGLQMGSYNWSRFAARFAAATRQWMASWEPWVKTLRAEQMTGEGVRSEMRRC